MRFTKRSNRTGQMPELPMTSLIDVVFLLLVFFIVTVNFLREQELWSALQAERQPSGQAADLRPQIVRVQALDGRPVFLMGDRVLEDKLELTELLMRLPKDGGVFVKVAADVPVEAAAAALQATKDAGFIRVTYVPAG